MGESFKKLLVVALAPEWGILSKELSFEKTGTKNLFKIKNKPGCALLQVGPGEWCQKRFSDFLNEHKTESVLHFGSCGALTAGLKPGDLFQIKSIEHEGDVLENIQIPFDLKSANLTTSKTVLKNKSEKEQKASQTSCTIVDMESFFIAKLCLGQGIAYTGLRGVFDKVEDDLENMDDFYSEEGDLRQQAIAINLLKHPKLILQLPALKKRSDSLQKAQIPSILDYLA